MFDKKWKKFRKGDPITASDRNQIAQQAKNILIGGRGISVTRQGRHIVVDLKGPQIIRKREIFGNVFKLSAQSGVVQWAFDTGDEAYCVVAKNGSVYVGGARNSNWGNGGTQASVWRLSSGGNLLWAYDTGGDVHDIQATDDYVFAMSTSSGINKIDVTDGSLLASAVAGAVTSSGAGEGTCHALGINSTQIWTQKLTGDVLVYDHSLNSLYSTSGPLTGTIEFAHGLSVSDDYVVYGLTRDGHPPGTTGAGSVSLIISDTTPSVLYSRVPDGGSTPFTNGYGNSDIDGDLIASALYRDAGSFSGYASYALLIDALTGTNSWFFSVGSGALPAETETSTGHRADIAIDAAAEMVFYSVPLNASTYWNGAFHTEGQRDLFALAMDDGDVLWHWLSTGTKASGATGNDPVGIKGISAGRDGFVYVATADAVTPSMKVAD